MTLIQASFSAQKNLVYQFASRRVRFLYITLAGGSSSGTLLCCSFEKLDGDSQFFEDGRSLDQENILRRYLATACRRADQA